MLQTMITNRFLIFLTVCLVPPLIFNYWLNMVENFTNPEIPEDGYWRLGKLSADDITIRPFRIQSYSERLKSLKDQLSPDNLSLTKDLLSDSRYTFLKNLTQKIASDFDWEQHVRFLNSFKHFTTEIEGLSIHFVRSVLPPTEKFHVVPLMLVHGFPGTFWDFFKMIPILSNPERFGFDFGVKRPILFDVVVPSLPGFGFSDKPQVSGMAGSDISRLLMKLSKRLDMEPFFVHGTEWLGSEVATEMASRYPDKIQGVHVSNPIVQPCFSHKVALKLFTEKYIGNRTNLEDFYEDPLLPPFILFSEQKNSIHKNMMNQMLYLIDFWTLYSLKTFKVEINTVMTLDEMATVAHFYLLTETLDSALEIMENSFGQNKCSRSQVKIPSALGFSPETPWHLPHSVLRHRYTNISQSTEYLKGGMFVHLQDANAVAADIFRFVEKMLL